MTSFILFSNKFLNIASKRETSPFQSGILYIKFCAVFNIAEYNILYGGVIVKRDKQLFDV
jgi:hypothetical protein